jgi:hypothetical protein
MWNVGVIRAWDRPGEAVSECKAHGKRAFFTANATSYVCPALRLVVFLLIIELGASGRDKP